MRRIVWLFGIIFLALGCQKSDGPPSEVQSLTLLFAYDDASKIEFVANGAQAVRIATKIKPSLSAAESKVPEAEAVGTATFSFRSGGEKVVRFGTYAEGNKLYQQEVSDTLRQCYRQGKLKKR